MRTTPWLVLLYGLLLGACNNTADDDSTESTTTGTGCAEACQDQRVAYAIDDTLWLLWNENFAGQPSGSKDFSAACPLGGTAAFTGTTGVGTNGINTVHLTVHLQHCTSAKPSYSLAFTGTVTFDGSFSDTAPNAVSFKSDTLSIEGAVTYGQEILISEICAVALTDTYDELRSQSSWLNGQLCGRNVSQ